MIRAARPCLLLLFLSLPELADAQIVASEKASVSQTIDGTVITVAYSRPSLRGRSGVYGTTTVPDSVLWTPGADDATTLEISRDARIGGEEVPAGKYTVWMVVTEGAWDIILDPRDEMWHVPHPARTDSQIVFSAMPDTTRRLRESLQFAFPSVNATGATLEMHWERTSVTFPIEVTPSRDLTISEEEAGPYLGKYLVQVEGNEDFGQKAFDFEMPLATNGDYLAGHMVFGEGMSPETMYLAPAADQVFNPVFLMNGEISTVVGSVFFEFTLDDSGNATSFEVRFGDEDELWMTGKRQE